jgi:osmotically inducible protein OsmC
VTLEQVGDGFSVTSSVLDTSVDVPSADRAAFDQAAEAAKSGCPISKLLNARITMHARLA